MNVFILESRNIYTEGEWRTLSIYRTSESAQRAMAAMYKNICKPDGGYELRTVQRMVHP